MCAAVPSIPVVFTPPLTAPLSSTPSVATPLALVSTGGVSLAPVSSRVCWPAWATPSARTLAAIIESMFFMGHELPPGEVITAQSVGPGGGGECQQRLNLLSVRTDRFGAWGRALSHWPGRPG